MLELVVEGKIVPAGIVGGGVLTTELLVFEVTGTETGSDEVVELTLLDEPEEGRLVPTVGGGLAWEGSSKAPIPQGMGLPSGSVGLAGGTELPFASAMVKRVVHVKLGELGELNW